jgi:hypothetical protein
MEMHECPRAINPEDIAVMVQRSRGDSTYSLGVACAFRHIAGSNWPLFCDLYDTTKQYDIMPHRGKLRSFWRTVKKSKYYSEFISTAGWYIRIKEAV